MFGEPSELDDMLHFKMEDLWDRVKDWARDNGHQYDPSYGVVGVAPT